MQASDMWTVVWHEKGSMHVKRMRDLLEVNRLHFARGETGYLVLDVVMTMEEAQARKRELRGTGGRGKTEGEES